MPSDGRHGTARRRPNLAKCHRIRKLKKKSMFVFAIYENLDRKLNETFFFLQGSSRDPGSLVTQQTLEKLRESLENQEKQLETAGNQWFFKN